jgi:hypothetical protein
LPVLNLIQNLPLLSDFNYLGVGEITAHPGFNLERQFDDYFILPHK